MKQLIIWIFAILPTLLIAQAPPKTIQEAAVGSLNYTEDRIIQLAEAIPEDKYDWRPAEGIRSVGESLMHLAAANYFVAMTAGHTPPADVDPMSLEKTVTNKDDILAAVKASYIYAREGAEAISKKHLGDKVDFPFPGNYNKMSALMVATGHCSEHLGQLIAYARMNGIVPPWSESESEDE